MFDAGARAAPSRVCSPKLRGSRRRAAPLCSPEALRRFEPPASPPVLAERPAARAPASPPVCSPGARAAGQRAPAAAAAVALEPLAPCTFDAGAARSPPYHTRRRVPAVDRRARGRAARGAAPPPPRTPPPPLPLRCGATTARRSNSTRRAAATPRFEWRRASGAPRRSSSGSSISAPHHRAARTCTRRTASTTRPRAERPRSRARRHRARRAGEPPRRLSRARARASLAGRAATPPRGRAPDAGAVANMAAPADDETEVASSRSPPHRPVARATRERKRALKLVVSSGFVAYSAAAAALAEVAFEPARPRGQPLVFRGTTIVSSRADLEVRRIRKRPTAGAMRRAAE